jgi:hypothetical protein
MNSEVTIVLDNLHLQQDHHPRSEKAFVVHFDKIDRLPTFLFLCIFNIKKLVLYVH